VGDRILDRSLVAFVTAALPGPPARLLEIGAGRGELAEHLTQAGYDVVAIDPAGHVPHVQAVALDRLEAPNASFDAALAVLSLHHVEPLRRSGERLAEMLPPGAPFVIDEFDIGAFGAAEARWWLSQGPAHGDHAGEPEAIAGDMRAHLHELTDVVTALEPWFEFGRVERLPYLYRWGLDADVRTLEEQAIARGQIAATGARVVARRRDYIGRP
jgi:SAM-dependent methyltransferase